VQWRLCLGAGPAAERKCAGLRRVGTSRRAGVRPVGPGPFILVVHHALAGLADPVRHPLIHCQGEQSVHPQRMQKRVQYVFHTVQQKCGGGPAPSPGAHLPVPSRTAATHSADRQNSRYSVQCRVTCTVHAVLTWNDGDDHSQACQEGPLDLPVQQAQGHQDLEGNPATPGTPPQGGELRKVKATGTPSIVPLSRKRFNMILWSILLKIVLPVRVLYTDPQRSCSDMARLTVRSASTDMCVCTVPEEMAPMRAHETSRRALRNTSVVMADRICRLMSAIWNWKCLPARALQYSTVPQHAASNIASSLLYGQ